MDTTVIMTLFLVFFVFLALGVPISFSIGLATFAALTVNFSMATSADIIAQKAMTGLNSFGLLAVPFFILAGNIMNRGGIAKRLVDFANVFVGWLPGSLSHINIFANMLFGAISGSAVSAAAAVGGIMAPIQKEEGYDPAFAASVNIASCPSGLLIPPSGVLILYSLVSGGTSVAALFVAGYLPGLLMGVGLMLPTIWLASRLGIKGTSVREGSTQKIVAALPSLALIVVVIGGIVGGIFTATEASAIAVIYSLVLALLYKEITFSQLPSIFRESAITTCIVLFLVGTSMGMSWVMASANVPAFVSSVLGQFSDQPLLVLLFVNIFLLVIGTFMDLTPAVLIFTPIFLPIMKKIGIDPVHFGMIMVFNLCIGICTPPVGSALFIGCSVADVPMNRVIRYLIPMYVVLFVVLLLVTYIPGISLWLPKLFGLM
ncbi:MAG: hypothetical protein CL920_21005 [Deltaproteobacteria bacterium]|nr:hypothetical protein [Deltaproteobacteria bacterium]|tara:strand:- start:8665 stop:9957 length:1293 start_codon:yes stop_codon:yes gene_type:complete